MDDLVDFGPRRKHRAAGNGNESQAEDETAHRSKAPWNQGKKQNNN
ncbi:hypothetical protein RAD15_25810 [Bradyrhizobium sp. 14AA]